MARIDLPSLDSLLLDIRYAVRTLRRDTRFTVLAVLILGLGLGVNIAVFTVTDAVLFKGFRGVGGNDRLLYIGTQKDGSGCCVSYPDFSDWRTQVRSFDDLGAVADRQSNLIDAAGTPEHCDATEITANGFRLLGVSPTLGRDFTSADEQPGAAPVAILAAGFWRRRYGADPGVLGRTIRLDGTPTTIVGIMPPGFSFPQNQDLWVPLIPTSGVLLRSNRHLWFAFGRLVPGATFATARAELKTIGARLATAYPQTNGGWMPAPRTFAQFFVGVNAPTVYAALWAAVGFVLLIACANFANLLLGRAIGRSREISVRIALGAGRSRVVRQLALEGVLLSIAAGVAGWAIAQWGVRAYEAAANAPTRSWSAHLLDYTVDHRVVVYAMLLSIGSGLLSALIPALRLASLDVHAGLKDGGRTATESRRSRRLSAMLVSAQLGFSVVLVAGAGVMVHSFLNLYTADLGIQPKAVLTGLVSLPPSRYSESSARTAFFDRLERRLAALPGVDSVTIASAPPATRAPRRPLEIESLAPADEAGRPAVSSLAIGPEYFRTLGAAVISGRDFTDADRRSGGTAAIVNEQFASTYWPREDPIGRRLRLFDGNRPGAWLSVVGVASNIVQDGMRQRRDPLVYVEYGQEQSAPAMWVFVRARVAPGSLAPAFQHEVLSIDPDLPVWLGPVPLTERLAGVGAYWSTRNEAALLFVFALAGLVLASAGVYAVIAQAVRRRTQEIGVRIAIGATGSHIVSLVFRQAVPPLALGLATGVAASVAVNRFLQSELVEVSPTDPQTYVMTCAVLMTCAAIGCVVPALRALRVDPAVALRHE